MWIRIASMAAGAALGCLSMWIGADYPVWVVGGWVGLIVVLWVVERMVGEVEE